MGVFKVARILVWNTIVGVLFLALVRWLWLPDMPLLWWPLLLAIVFGFPGSIAASLIWWYLTTT